MFAAALALAAAVSWGIGDFLGGLKSRTLRPIAVLIVAQPIGGALLGIWVAIRGEAPPGTEVLWASLAAIFGTTGLIAFYRGMAAGALSIVAPIAGRRRDPGRLGAGPRRQPERLPGARLRGGPRRRRARLFRTSARGRALGGRRRLGRDRDGRLRRLLHPD